MREQGIKKGGDKKKSALGGVGRLSPEEWYALSDTKKAKLRKEREDAKKDGEKKPSNKSSKPKNSNDKSTSGESVASLQKQVTALKKVNSSLKKTAFTLINEGAESDLSDEEGSNNFLAGLSMISEASPRFAKWHGQQFANAKAKGSVCELNLTEEVLLDSETTHVLFCNPKFVRNIRESHQALRMSGNGGMMRITQKADLPGLFPSHIEPAETWFSHKAITNLLSFKCLNDIYRITYDSKIEKTFIVPRSEYGMTDLRFVEHLSGLHILP